MQTEKQTRNPKPCGRMLPNFKQVRAILNKFFFSQQKNHFFFPVYPGRRPFSIANNSHEELSSFNFSGIAKTVISKCSNLCDDAKCNDISLKEYFLRLSEISPWIVRRFWRIIDLKPQDVFEILLGFDSDCGKYEVEVKKTTCLWGIFMQASENNSEFLHFPLSCKIMASMLVRIGFFREVEYVLSRRESEGILLDCQGIFNSLTEGYVAEFELEKAISTYDRMRGLALVPSLLSYQALLNYLIGLNETQLMYNIYVDMIRMGMSVEGDHLHDSVFRLLCVDGKVQESRDLVKEVMAFGIKPSRYVIKAICCGYCEKKDYDDILSFFAEIRIVPDAIVGNRILFSLCRDFGVEQAGLFMQKMEEIGFYPNEITLGILIGFSCYERKMKNAFIHLSDALSRSLKLHVYSYNALLSGIFVKGIWSHSRNILLEMHDAGVDPDLSTYRVLLAGFSKARQFDEVKAVICEMSSKGLIKLSPTEDPQIKGFILLGFDPSGVKIRRDNDVGFSKAEFYDNLGNGLYLDTNPDTYEKIVTDVLDRAMIPDFNSLVLENCRSQEMKDIFIMVDEMEIWGQELSLFALAFSLKRLSSISLNINSVNHLLETTFKSTYQLDQQALNVIVRMYCRQEHIFPARMLIDGMRRRHLNIENSTYSALLIALCKKNDLRGLLYFLQVSRKYNWFPELKDSQALFRYLCQNKRLNEALMLLETMFLVFPRNVLNIFFTFLEELCCQGFASAALVLLIEFSNNSIVLDHTAYDHLINGFCKEERLQDALMVLDFMLSKNLVPAMDPSIQLILQLFRTNNMDKALGLKDMCVKENPSDLLSVHCALVNGFCKLKMPDIAASLFKETLLTCIVRDTKAFNMLIQRYCQTRSSRKVMELFGLSIKKSLSVSVSSYSNIVCLLCTERMFPQALCLKDLVQKESNIPDIFTYNVLLFYMFAVQNTFCVDVLICELLKKGLQYNEATYNYLIQGFIENQCESYAVQYLVTMISQDLKPSNRSFRKVIGYLCRNNETEKVMYLSREMETRGWVHGSVIQNAIVQALLNNGKLHEALDFLNRMERKNLIPDNVKYDYAIKQLYCHGSLEKAVDLLNIMLQKGSVPESSSYDCVIQGHCNGPKLDIALDFHAEMMHRNLKPSMTTWEVLVHRLCEDDKVVEAENLLNSMMQLDETPSRKMFCTVINKYHSTDNISKASELLKVMQEMGYLPDFDTHWSFISNINSSSKRGEAKCGRSFLSGLLSDFGFAQKNSNEKRGSIAKSCNTVVLV